MKLLLLRKLLLLKKLLWMMVVEAAVPEVVAEVPELLLLALVRL